MASCLEALKDWRNTRRSLKGGKDKPFTRLYDAHYSKQLKRDGARDERKA